MRFPRVIFADDDVRTAEVWPLEVGERAEVLEMDVAEHAFSLCLVMEPDVRIRYSIPPTVRKAHASMRLPPPVFPFGC